METATYSVPAITQEVHDEGLVLAFIDITGTGDLWYAMPFTLNATGNVTTLGYLHRVGQLSVQISNEADIRIAFLFNNDLVKVITAPPGAAREALEGVDLTDYEAVTRALASMPNR